VSNSEPPNRQPYHVRAIERAIDVIRTFGPGRSALTLSEVASATGLDRATTRRMLLTLQDLGYVRADGKRYSLTPMILQLGYSYLSGLSLVEIARPHLQSLAHALGETASLTILDGDDVVYLDLAASSRLSSVRITVGTRFRAHATSMGRVLLGGLSTDLVDEYFSRVTAKDRPERLVRPVSELRAEVDEAAHRGWAIVDEELEEGLRGVAAPIRERRGLVVAAVNVSVHAARHSIDDVAELYVPAMLAAASSIEADLYGMQT